MRSLEKAQHEEIPTHTYSLSQADMENDVYSTPVDQLPPSAGTRIIAPQKKLGEYLYNNIIKILKAEWGEEGEGGTATFWEAKRT